MGNVVFPISIALVFSNICIESISSLALFPYSARHLKRGSPKKSKVLISKTTYSSKSMSSCSVCGNTPCSTNHVLSTIKSMSLCLSSLDNDLPDGSLDDVPDNNSQLSKPHNSTFLSEDLNISLKDLVPEDLSPIMGEFLMVRMIHFFVSYSFFISLIRSRLHKSAKIVKMFGLNHIFRGTSSRKDSTC